MSLTLVMTMKLKKLIFSYQKKMSELARMRIVCLKNIFVKFKIAYELKCIIMQINFLKDIKMAYPKNSVFALMGEKTTDSSLLYFPRVFLWFPHVLFKKFFKKELKCPGCQQTFGNNGYTRPLLHAE